MKYLRRSVIVLALGLAVFFNIERLNLEKTNVINIASFVYILGLMAVILIITLPILWRSSVRVSLVSWGVIYFLGKLFIFNDRPLIGGPYSYLTITELALLSLLILLAHNLARGLHDFEEAIEKITLPKATAQLRQLDEAEEVIHYEMTRSRLYHRPLSVAVLDLEPESIQTALHHTVQEVQQAMMTRYVFTSLARVIVSHVERTDLVMEQRDKNRFIILCPEKKTAQLTETMERIRTFAAEKLGVTLTGGTAAFPDEAVTFEALIERAVAQRSNSAELVSKHLNPERSSSSIIAS
jgi:hypothetical protein